MYRTRNTAKIHRRRLWSCQSLHHKSWRRTFSNGTIECNFLFLLSVPFVFQIKIPLKRIWTLNISSKGNFWFDDFPPCVLCRISFSSMYWAKCERFYNSKGQCTYFALWKNLCVTVFHDCLIWFFQDIGEYLQKVGHEFGVTTGRKRRCGWLDIPLLKYTSMVNGYSAVALTKLDILDDMDEIQIGVTYKKHGEPMEHFPSCEQVSFFKSCYDFGGLSWLFWEVSLMIRFR